MLATRFHGRGGHGIKTAGRILGTAAFLEGHEVQDSPVYGAERRGAPVTAFTRIDDKPVLERGPIERPDLIVVSDETLLGERSAAVLAGAEVASAVFVNAEKPPELPADMEGRLRWLDVTGRTLDILGGASALSAALAAAAARLGGKVSAERLRESVLEELSELGLSDGTIEKNARVAAEVFEALEPVRLRRAESSSPGHVPGTCPGTPPDSTGCNDPGIESSSLLAGGRFARSRSDEAFLDRLPLVEYDGPVLGRPSILAVANAGERRTAAWRVERPRIDRELCTRCSFCFVRCPDGAIALDDEGYPVIDYDHCKGCMICLQTCPLDAVHAEREVRAW